MTDLPEDKLRHELEERLRFDTLLSDISVRYINLPVEQIDESIEDDQRRICEFLGLDVSVLWQWSDTTPRFMTVTHLHTPPEGPSRPERIDAQEAFPWQYQKMLRGELLAFSTDEMPPEAARDQESRRHFGVKSSVVLPLLFASGSLIGVLTFDTLRKKRDWTAGTVKRLMLVAQVFCNALLRKESDRILRESEARLSLAAESAEAGLWELNLSTEQIWVTERAREIFGYGTGEIIDMKRFERSLFAEDLVQVQQAITRSLEKNKAINIEYRILTGDGVMKWVHSSGRPYFKPNGGPDRLLGVSIDITERKVSEMQNLRNEMRFATAIDIAELGFYEMDKDYNVNFLDDRMRELFGITPEDESRGREFWLAHIHPEDLPRILAKSKQVLEEGVDRFTTEYQYIHPQRGLIWFHHLSRVMERNAAGKAALVIGVVKDITERKLMEETLRENEAILRNNQKDLQRLAGRMISVKEEELRRLSRELHDDLTQRLAVLAIEAGKLELHMNQDAPSLSESIQKISQIKEQLIKVSEDVHRISRQLHPTILDDLGLVRAIESECLNLMQIEDIDIIFTSEDVHDRLPDDVPLCLYRITQEGLHNVINHSGVKSCEVVLKGTDDTICLTVKDQGVGFDPVEVRNKPGLGLSSMRERIQLVGGNLSVDSQPARGTTIRVTIPLERTET